MGSSQIRLEVGDDNGAIEVNRYANEGHLDGEIFVEVFDYSGTGGKAAPVGGCVILTEDQALDLIEALRSAINAGA